MATNTATHFIFDLNNLPFVTFDGAAKMRDLLIKETGRHYQVDNYEGEQASNDTKGFVVVAENQSPLDNPYQRDKTLKQAASHKKTLYGNTHIQPKAFRQALRTWLLRIPVLLVTLLLILFPLEVWINVLSLLEIQTLPAWISADVLLNVTQWAGWAFFVYFTVSIAVPYFSTQLLIDVMGVTFKQGIISQETIKIRFSEIRTIGMKQGIVDRLLNIGTLELASSGSDGVDIRFFNIAHPKAVRDSLQSYVNQAHP